MRFYLGGAALAAALVIGTSCTDVESDSVLTSGMSATVTAVAKGDGSVNVAAILRVGGLMSTTFAELSGDDSLTVAAADAAPVDMVETEIGALHTYGATIAGDDPSTVYTVALVRTVDDGAPATTISVPTAFTLDAPADRFSRAADFTLTWSPAADEPMEITAEGDCINLYVNTQEADGGTFTIPAGDITAIEGQEATNCEVSFTLKRSKPGTLDPAFGEGGSAVGIQQREATSNSTP